MSPDERAIRDLVATWHSATVAGDVDAVLRLMSEDVVFLVAGQAPMRGRSAFENGLRRLLETHRIESSGSVQEVEASGRLAYCWTQLTVGVVPLAGGKAISRTGYAMSILHKRADDSWVVVRDANMLPPVA